MYNSNEAMEKLLQQELLIRSIAPLQIILFG
jgi:hypothetical protein